MCGVQNDKSNSENSTSSHLIESTFNKYNLCCHIQRPCGNSRINSDVNFSSKKRSINFDVIDSSEKRSINSGVIDPRRKQSINSDVIESSDDQS